MDLEYLDLYLIHWPGAYGVNSTNASNKELRQQSWESLAKGVKEGIVRNIGVSNYNVKHLEELFAKDFGVKPAVNQVNNIVSYIPIKHLIYFSRLNGIHTTIQKMLRNYAIKKAYCCKHTLLWVAVTTQI